MIDLNNQEIFNQTIMLMALSMCFKSNEEYLSEDQIISRGYAPIDSYGKFWLSKLIDEKTVRFKATRSSLSVDNEDETIFILSPGGLDRKQESYLYENTEMIVNSIRQSADCLLYLKVFHKELLACEVIEYAEFYTRKNGFKMQNASPTNSKLKLMLAEKKQKQVNSLMWRAIKKVLNKTGGDSEIVEFSNIVDEAFDCYVRYQKLKIKIDEYNRPLQFKTSNLSATLNYIIGKMMEKNISVRPKRLG